MKEVNIEHEKPEVVATTTYWKADLIVNNKNISISKWVSYDDNIGITDDGFEICDGEECLTEKEKKAVERYVEDIKFE